MSMRFPLAALAVLCLLNTGCTSKKPCPEDTLISTGRFINNWVYENDDLGLSIQLPTNWYLIDGFSHWDRAYTEHYSMIYHKDIPLDTPMSSFEMKQLIVEKNFSLKEIRESKAEGPFHLFRMLEVHETEIIPEQKRRMGDPVISFNIIVSKHQDADDDLKELLNYIKPAWEKDPEIDLRKTTIKVGNTELKGLSFKSPSVPNHFLTRAVFLKNYDCYDLGIMIDYATPKQLEGIKQILANAKL